MIHGRYRTVLPAAAPKVDLDIDSPYGDETEGVLTARFNSRASYGAVCADGFGAKEAKVACR